MKELICNKRAFTTFLLRKWGLPAWEHATCSLQPSIAQSSTSENRKPQGRLNHMKLPVAVGQKEFTSGSLLWHSSVRPAGIQGAVDYHASLLSDPLLASAALTVGRDEYPHKSRARGTLAKLQTASAHIQTGFAQADIAFHRGRLFQTVLQRICARIQGGGRTETLFFNTMFFFRVQYLLLLLGHTVLRENSFKIKDLIFLFLAF